MYFFGPCHPPPPGTSILCFYLRIYTKLGLFLKYPSQNVISSRQFWNVYITFIFFSPVYHLFYYNMSNLFQIWQKGFREGARNRLREGTFFLAAFGRTWVPPFSAAHGYISFQMSYHIEVQNCPPHFRKKCRQILGEATLASKFFRIYVLKYTSEQHYFT